MNQQRATIIISRTPEEARLERENFMRRHGGKTAVEVMHEQQAMRLKEWHDQQYWFLSGSLVPKSEFKASSPLKQSAELLAEIFNTRTALYELARLFSALSLKTANYQRGISERIVESMTDKNRSSSLQRTVLFTIFRGSFNNEQKRLFTTP